jgi:hypothetical protein
MGEGTDKAMSRPVFGGMHVLGIIWSMLIPLFSWNKYLLLATLYVYYVVQAQWNVVGYCILNALENGKGNNRSFLCEKFGEFLNLSYEDAGKVWVYVKNFIPGSLCAIKLLLLALG